ncbi:MFS transporter [Pseudomonas sp. HR96]|uniref:MFS transporter n=1 Tax=Pseudomonas sp. HR96 TaxID=1027966 RepID=UPI002A762D58|nr:MFS transporter [Pseudomonas sp. HR96]WPP02068.1 MFS transporter [Pseudomonas sp. HR96]
MSHPAPPPAAAPAGRRRLVIALLMAVMVISVLDKTIFAFAGTQIIDELHLSAEQFGFVGSAFFFLYSLSGTLVGFLANRLATRRILGLMALLWTSAQLLVVCASGLGALTASRLLLGAACGPGTAVTQHASFKWYGADRQVLPASLIQVSIMLGGLLGAIALPLSISHFGWRTAYLLLAALSLVWMLAWWRWGAEGREGASLADSGGVGHVPYRHLLLNRTFVWISLMCFVAYLPNALSFSWSAVYLQKGLGLSAMQAGYVLLGATSCIILVNLLLSALSQRLLKRGHNLQRSLVLPPMACCMLGGLALCGLAVAGAAGLLPKLTCYVLGSVLLNGVFAFGMTITSHIAPLRQRGAMLAIHVGCMTLAGVLAPWAVGRLITFWHDDIARGFEVALQGIGLTALIGAVLGLYLITPGSTRQQLQARWSR